MLIRDFELTEQLATQKAIETGKESFRGEEEELRDLFRCKLGSLAMGKRAARRMSFLGSTGP